MYTRRTLLTGGVGAVTGAACLTIGSVVADEVQTTEIRYVVVRNTTADQQSVDVVFESDDGPVSWETYELDPDQAAELSGVDPVSDYQVVVRWDGETYAQRLKPGRRAIAIVLAVVGDQEVIIRDVPFSSLSPAQRSTNSS